MPRGEKRVTQREEVSLAEERPVRLQASKRFFTARGSDQAVRQARALSDAFGVGVQLVSEEIDRRNIKGEQRALGAAATGEERDITDKNLGYNKAWDELDAERDINFMQKELPEILRGADWENLEEHEVRGIISDHMKSQLEGVDPAGFYGRAIIPAMLAMEAETLATHRDMVIERIQTEQRSSILANMQSRFEASKLQADTPEGVFDYDYLADQTGIFFDGSDKKVVYWESIIDFAIENGRPDIIENVPERFTRSGDPTGITDPLMQTAIRNGLAKATSVQQAMKKAAEDQFRSEYQTNRAAQHSDLTTRAKAADASVINDIVAGGEDGPEGQPRLLSRAQQKTLFDQLTAAQIAGAVDSNNGNLFGEGRAFGMTETEYDNAASNFADELDKRLSRENPELSEEQRESEVLKVVLERSWRHDRLPKFITDFLNVSPSSPERFKQAVNVKRMVDEYDDTLVQRSISDRNAALMDVYDLTITDTGNEQAAMEALGQYDHTLSQGRGDEIAKIADESLETLAGDSGFFPADYEITTRDRKRAGELAKHYLNLGYSDDQIEAFVVTGMRGRNTRVQGVMYPVNAGWRKGDEAADWYLGTTAPDFFAEKEDMVMKPHPTKNGYVVIQDSSAMLPYASPEVKISEIENAYQRSQDEQLVRLAAEAEAPVSEGMKEAERRAFEDAFPPANLAFVEPGARTDAMARNREAWDNMPEADRKRLIQRQMK
jgi:hypothetical protein